jgi:hypothetical protein
LLLPSTPYLVGSIDGLLYVLQVILPLYCGGVIWLQRVSSGRALASRALYDDSLLIEQGTMASLGVDVDAKSEFIAVSYWHPTILRGVERGQHAGCNSHARNVSVKYTYHTLTAV